MQLLLYATATSPRLQYTCNFIFKEILKGDFLITTQPEEFNNYKGPKIKYANEPASPEHFTIGTCGLLLETNTRNVEIQCFKDKNYVAFFKTENADFPFDIFSATFYLISRYEEYLPHKKDSYGRYAHENSLAFKENFLNLPLSNIWVMDLALQLKSKFSIFNFQFSIFNFIPTYDIDMAYAYRQKGWLRNAGGFIKSPSFSRIKVLLGLEKDPFDSYDWLHHLHSENKLQPLYFFLLADQNGKYDKNILPSKKVMKLLIKTHAKKYGVGIHPSWQSGDNPLLQKKEKELLETIVQTPITKSRQHYIRLTLPEGYRQLPANGIADDYSMGYGSINGFRASVASAFFWFDLQKNEATSLRIHPFCFMDANSYYEQKYTPDEAFRELVQYYSACKEVGGQLITIWHNNFLGTDPQFAGWREVYQQFITGIKK